LNVKEAPSNAVLVEIAKGAALNAGRVLLSRFRREGTSLDFDGQNGDQSRSKIGSDADNESEQEIIKYLCDHATRSGYESLLVYSEGIGASKIRTSEATAHPLQFDEFLNSQGLKWVVDPLCGSIPYARGVADFIVSIAAMIDQKIVVGVVYDPVQNELFSATTGEGAFLNGKPISPSKTDVLKKAYVSIEHKIIRKSAFDGLNGLISEIARLRVAGTCGLEMCYVANGRLDGLIKLDQDLYDYAAGLLILLETKALGSVVVDQLRGADIVEPVVRGKRLSFVATAACLQYPLLNTLGELKV
jgi:fructose-1,6-bisphosphatase/inositol monophosphatase family enzyme